MVLQVNPIHLVTDYILSSPNLASSNFNQRFPSMPALITLSGGEGSFAFHSQRKTVDWRLHSQKGNAKLSQYEKFYTELLEVAVKAAAEIQVPLLPLTDISTGKSNIPSPPEAMFKAVTGYEITDGGVEFEDAKKRVLDLIRENTVSGNATFPGHMAG